MKQAPPYLHITKAGKRKEMRETHFEELGNHSSFTPYVVPDKSSWPKKQYRVPVNYLVTTYVHIEAVSLEDAILEAQSVSAPHLDIYDSSAHDTVVESEVLHYEVEERD